MASPDPPQATLTFTARPPVDTEASNTDTATSTRLRTLRLTPATPAHAPAIAACFQRVHAEPGSRLRPFPDAVRAGGPAAVVAYVGGWIRPELGRFVFVAIDAETDHVVSTQTIDLFTRENTVDDVGNGHPAKPFTRLLDPPRPNTIAWSGVVAGDDAVSAPQLVLPPPKTLEEEEGPSGSMPSSRFRWDRDGGEALVHFGNATTAAELRGLKCAVDDAAHGNETSAFVGASVNEALRVFGIRQVLLGSSLPGETRSAVALETVTFAYNQRVGGPLIPTACRAIARFIGSVSHSSPVVDDDPQRRHRRGGDFALATTAFFTDLPFTIYTQHCVCATAAAADRAKGNEGRRASLSSRTGTSPPPSTF